MARNTVRFLLGHELREIENPAPDTTVLNYLRLEERRCGTKEGCAEGDCGACSVVVGRLEGERIVYQAVNACIQFLPALDGCQLLTVEDLQSDTGSLHPVQQAMVEEHATQCGFCTPGFVMSLFALYHQPGKPDRRFIEDTLAGNLCRCTGYGPIVNAAQQACSGKPADQFVSSQSTTIQRLQQLAEDEPLLSTAVEGGYVAPGSLTELSQVLLESPDATVVAGGTDVGLWVTKQHQHLQQIVSVTRVPELRHIECVGQSLEIGSAVTYSEAIPFFEKHIPALADLVTRIGSTQIRNAGTLGGNIANGSPIGDMPPALIALGATLQLRRGAHVRTLPLESFFIEYGKQDLHASEFIEKIMVPIPAPHDYFSVYKISKRFDQDISAVCAAFFVSVAEADQPVVQLVRLAYGGMAGTPSRAQNAEAQLQGASWSHERIEQAAQALALDFEPLSDQRASRDYRMRVSQNLLSRFYLESQQTVEQITLERVRGQCRV